MTTLQNFPLVSERTQVTGDGKPSENAGLDCVPASLCSGAMYLNGIHTLGGAYTPDSWKDAAYGDGYVGGTGASAYVAYAASLGIKLWHYDAARTADLVAEVHRQIQAGHPVAYTEPNPYGNPNYTHVCVFFQEDTGTLTAMDPWITQAVTKSDQAWASTLVDGQIWIMQRSTMVPTGWKDDGTTLVAPNGIPVVHGFRDYLLAHAWDPQNYPLEPEQARNPLEHSNPALGKGARQVFRMGALEWTADRGVFPAWIGQELLTVEQATTTPPKTPSVDVAGTVEKAIALLQPLVTTR